MTPETKPGIAAIVLAAGGSSRFGSPKQLVEREGEPLIRRAATAALEAGAVSVFVVLGANAVEVSAALANLPNVICVTNPDWESGLSSSLATGFNVVLRETECEAALVTLADQAFVDGAALASIISAFDCDHRLVASSYDGIIGVPALFAKEFLDGLTHLSGDAGAGEWLRARRDAVTAIPLQKAALDIDTPLDASMLK